MTPTAAELLGRCTFPASGAVDCAVSGGADSLALLVLAVEAGLAVTAVHVDHGLRSDSADDAAVVKAAADRFGAGFRAEWVDVAPGPNLEARARAARYGVLGREALLGHTADDQAETVLLNLLRGAGLEGLAGMRAGPRRPILAIRRHETEALCAAVGLDPIVDPSNHDPVHRRNRVRHELLPLLDDIAGRDVAAVVARQAELLRQAADLLASQAAELDATDVRVLARAPRALRAIALREWLRNTTDERHPPDAATIERALGVVDGSARATDVGGGWRLARTEGRLRLERPGDSSVAPDG